MRTASQLGINAIDVFLLFGTAMAAFAATLLIYPGTVLDRARVLNPTAQRELGRFGKPFGVGFLLLGMVLAIAAIVWLRRKYWAWLLTVTILLIQAIEGVVNFVRAIIFEADWAS